jgi:glycosyltransferase involved in cell wall biosynthesis
MPEPAPVLLLARALGLGGSERQLAEIARALDRRLFAPHAGCFHAEGFRAEELCAAGVPVAEFSVPSFLSPGAFSGALALGRYIRRHGIQLVHSFDVPLNLFAVPVARLFRAPRVVSSQRADRALTPGLRRHLLRVTDKLVDAIVVNSEAVRRDLIARDHLPPRLIHLCYNGIDAQQFQPPEMRVPGPVVIGVICALRPEKDLQTLLEAFARLEFRPDVELAIIGSGSTLPDLQRRAAQLGLEKRCRFEPATKHVAERLRSIDIFVLPSLSEAFSNSLMEAMACGCCVVASRVGGNPELVIEGESGLLFQAGDPGDLARQLALLVRDRNLRDRLAAAAVRRIRENFTIAQSAQRMAAIYRALLAGEEAASPAGWRA